MKNFRISHLLILFSLAFLPLKTFANSTTDSTGLPGDNLDLRAVLDLFKQSSNPEDFEKKLNTKENHVNNLDLDGDKEVDYIRVVDLTKDDIHDFVLRVAINATESQDVAVIELEKKGDEVAYVQIVGDEELYGDKYIVEPKAETKTDSTISKWKGSPSGIVIVNVWYWPCVQYVYYPSYIIWVSPWSWMYWPYWWTPWQPYPYYMYYGYVYYYQEYYYCTDEYQMTEANFYYGPRRVVSETIHQRYEPAHKQYEQQKKNKTKGNAIPTPAPQEKGNPVPQPKGDATPTPAPKPKGDATPIPVPQPKPDMHPQPVPIPQPQPNVHPQPVPNPQPRGDVHPQPMPQPAPRPNPQPSPRPKGKLRFGRKK